MIAPVLFTQVFAAAIGRFRGFGIPGAPFLLAALLVVVAMAVAERELTEQRWESSEPIHSDADDVF